MNQREAYRIYRGNARRKFIRTTVLSMGFLSGVWAHLGFSPSGFVRALLERWLITFDPAHAQAITIAFFIVPLLISIIAMLMVYRRAGILGFVALALAYLAGLWLNVYSIFLLAGAILIALVSVRR